MKTAEQAVHDILWKFLAPMVNGNIYEARPMNETGYPFADFGGSYINYQGTKLGNLLKVSISLNIWDTEEKRKNVSKLCDTMFGIAVRLPEAYGYKVSLRIGDSGIRIIQDRTVLPSLWRGMLNLVFDIL